MMLCLKAIDLLYVTHPPLWSKLTLLQQQKGMAGRRAEFLAHHHPWQLLPTLRDLPDSSPSVFCALSPLGPALSHPNHTVTATALSGD